MSFEYVYPAIQVLPTEMLAAVGTHLANADLYRATLVSRRFRNVFSHVLYARAMAQDGAQRALCWAAASGRLAMLRALVEQFGAHVHAADADGYTALHVAAQHGRLHEAAYLLSLGADARAECAKESWTGDQLFAHTFRATPLHLAAASDKPEMVRLLVERGGVPVDVMGAERTTPLHLAVFWGAYDAVKTLVRCGADVNLRSLFSGGRFTPLHFAMRAKKKNVLVAKHLLHHGADVDAPERGETCLHVAARWGDLYLAKALLDNGAAVDAPTAHDRNTPLHYACTQQRRANFHVVELLLAYGASLDARNWAGRTPLHRAVTYHHPHNPRMVEFLVRAGSDLYAHDRAGHTVLCGARNDNREPCRKVLDFLCTRYMADYEKAKAAGDDVSKFTCQTPQ